MKIYALYDPRDQSKFKYIGKTKMPLRKRLQAHVDESRKSGGTYKKNWIRSLLSINIKPSIVLVKETTLDNWQKDEIECISNYTGLTNTLPGGLCGENKFSVISQYTLNGVYIKTFESIDSACVETLLNRGSINSALQRWLKNENNIGGNFLWVYELNDAPKKYIKPYLNKQLTPVRIVDLKDNVRLCFESIDDGLKFFKLKRTGNVFRCINDGVPYKNRYSIVLLK